MTIEVTGLALSFLAVVIAALEFIDRRISSRRLLTYGVLLAAPLLHAPIDIDPQLRVVRRGKTLANPHVIELRIVNHGRRDLPSADFDNGNPLRLDLGTKIVTLLGTAFEPQGSPNLTVLAKGKVLEIGPGLIRKRMEMRFIVLVEGPDINLTCQSPLVNVDIESEALEATSSQKRASLKTVLGWCAVAFVLWWVIEAPDSAAHLVHNIGTFLTTAAHGLSNFFASF
jgi:hypothetical protein